MAEGHAVHGMAQRLARLSGRTVRSRGYPTAPLDFDAGIVDGAVVGHPEAHGKHLLVPFHDHPLTAHLHLGMAGRVSVRRHSRALGADGYPRTDPPAARGLRWRLLTAEHIAEISAPKICEWLDEAGVAALHARLGPDPLRPDADPDAFRRKVARSRRAIGHLVLDQSVLAGVGNVYRAEILWRLRIDPWRPGNELDPAQLDQLWAEAAELLEVGLGAGWIVTDEGQLRAARQLLIDGERVPRWPKVYAVYGRAGQPCRVCATTVRAAPMGQQRIFWCPTCQPAPGAARPVGALERSPTLREATASVKDLVDSHLMNRLSAALPHLGAAELIFRHDAVLAALGAWASGGLPSLDAAAGPAGAQGPPAGTADLLIAWVVGSLKAPAARRP